MKDHMHEIKVYVPTKTYNEISMLALHNGVSIPQFLSNGVFDWMNGESLSLCANLYALDQSTNTEPAPAVEASEFITQVIFSVLHTGINMYDVMMIALDKGFEPQDIVNALRGLIKSSLVEYSDQGILTYRYFANVDQRFVLSKIKGQKILTKPVKHKTITKPLKQKLKKG